MNDVSSRIKVLLIQLTALIPTGADCLLCCQNITEVYVNVSSISGKHFYQCGPCEISLDFDCDV